MRLLTSVPDLLVDASKFLFHQLLVGMSRVAAHAYRALPETSWERVEKHGENIVVGRPKGNYNLLKSSVVWVVDHRHKTVRLVWDIPQQYSAPGTMF